MKEIQIGEYCRTLSGIFKFKKETDSIYSFERNGEIFRIVKPDNLNKYVTKHSKNIIDLIEVGDIVNKGYIYEIGNAENGDRWVHNLNGSLLYNEDIKTILTHEQIDNNCYRIGE